tara:strand:+ start:901 stop:1425 length:525 start_codon:yes stop_codon:yes gene_type:complete
MVEGSRTSAVVNFSLITFVGVIILFFFPGTPSSDGFNGPATSAVWAYGIMACGLVGITALTGSGEGNTLNSLRLVPAAALLLVVVSLCMLNMYYFKSINTGHSPPQFETFNTISGYLVFVQTCVLIHYLFASQTDVVEGSGSSTSLGGLFLLNTLSMMVVVIMGIIMEFYKTDG